MALAAPPRQAVATAARPAAAKDGLPTTCFGCTTIYELFNNSVEKYGNLK